MQRIENPEIQLKITCDQSGQHNFEEEVSFIYEGKTYSYSKSKVLNALFTKHPLRNFFPKWHVGESPYIVNLPIEDNKTIPCNFILHNDIIKRYSLGSQKRIPKIIFKPVKVKGKRVLKPHVVYMPIVTGKETFRYSVMDSSVDINGGARANRGNPNYKGGGTFGNVYKILGTLAHLGEDLLFKTHKKRVNKSVELNSENPYLDIVKETNFLQQQNQLAAKSLLPLPNGRIDSISGIMHIVQKDAGFSDLKDFFIDNKKKNHQLTADEQYRLSINVLKALKEQVHDRGMVSKDIKPRNILVDPISLNVIMIDLGLAKQVIDPNNDAAGTPEYTAPEVIWNEVADERADFFSVGLVLSEIWGFPIDQRPAKEIIDERCYQRSTHFALPQFKHEREKLPLEIQKIISSLIEANPKNRIDLEAGINQLEEARFAKLVENAPNQKELLKNLSTANQLGKVLKENLLSLNYPSEFVLENLGKYIAILKKKKSSSRLLKEAITIQEDFNFLVTEYENFTSKAEVFPQAVTRDLEKCIANALNCIDRIEKDLKIFTSRPTKQAEAILSSIKELKLNDNEENNKNIITIFKESLGLPCLDACANTKEMADKVRTISDETNTNLQALSKAKVTLRKVKNGEEKKKLQETVDAIAKKFTRPNITFDMYKLLNERYKAEIDNSLSEISKLPIEETKNSSDNLSIFQLTQDISKFKQELKGLPSPDDETLILLKENINTLMQNISDGYKSKKLPTSEGALNLSEEDIIKRNFDTFFSNSLEDKNQNKSDKIKSRTKKLSQTNIEVFVKLLSAVTDENTTTYTVEKALTLIQELTKAGSITEKNLLRLLNHAYQLDRAANTAEYYKPFFGRLFGHEKNMKVDASKALENFMDNPENRIPTNYAGALSQGDLGKIASYYFTHHFYDKNDSKVNENEVPYRQNLSKILTNNF